MQNSVAQILHWLVLLWIIPYSFSAQVDRWRDLPSLIFYVLEKCRQAIVRFVPQAWASIPDYLPFYLVVIVVLYAAIKGRKPATVISPFNLPSQSTLPFCDRTVANALHDAFVDIRRRAEKGVRDRSGGLIGVGQSELQGLKLPEVINFEVPIQFTVEVKGLSHESLISLARKVWRTEQIISGDVVVVGKSRFRLLARSRGTDSWSFGSSPVTIEGLQQACEQLALQILETIDPTLRAAYDIAEENYEAAHKRLLKIVRHA